MVRIVAIVVFFALQAAPGDAAHDGRWHVTQRASVTEDGSPATWSSYSVATSATGDIVAFIGDIPQPLPSGGISSSDPGFMVFDRHIGETRRIPAAGASCWIDGVDVSADGSYVVLNTLDSLAPEDQNGDCDPYVFDRKAEEFDAILHDEWDSLVGKAISGDGRYIALVSNQNLEDAVPKLVIHDRHTDTTEVVVDSPVLVQNPSFSADARFLAYMGTKGPIVTIDYRSDVILFDRESGFSERLTAYVTERHDPENPERTWGASSYVFSENFRFLAYATQVYQGESVQPTGTTLVIHDRATAANVEIEVVYANLTNMLPGPVFANLDPFFISNDGQTVYFRARAGGHLASPPPPAHLFEFNRQAASLTRVDIAALDVIDVNSSGDPGDGEIGRYPAASASADGSVVAFVSEAGNLMPGEINNHRAGFNFPDVFVADRSFFFDTAGSIFEKDIQWLSAEGITRSCNPPLMTRFCPRDPVTRGQMAAFLVRAMGYVDNGGGDLFVDDDGSIFENDIDKLGTAGVTRGCNPPENNRFCPEETVTRAEMAAFLVRAMGYSDTGGGDLFIDDDGLIFENDIDRLGTAGVTKGCNPPTNSRFCPADIVTRDQMAAFLHRAIGDG